MADPKDLVHALYGAIFNSMEGSNLPQGSQPFISLEWPGLPLDPQQYRNPWSPENMSGSAMALEDFSALVDAIPAAAPVYVATGMGVEGVYGLLLGATVGAADGVIAKVFANAQAKFASVIRGSTENALAEYHPSYPSPLNWCDPANENLWTTATVNIGTSPAPGPSPKPATPLSQQVTRILQAQPGLAVWKMAPLHVPPAQIRPARGQPAIHPAMAMAPAVGKAPAALPAIAARSLQMRIDNPLVGARSAPLRSAGMKPVVGIRANLLPRIQLPVPAPPVTPAPKPAVQEKPVTSSSLQISLKYLRVTIQRPWMDPMLFHLKGWSLDGVDAGAMSNGSSDNPGFFPLLPIAFVAVKGVQISGNWSPDDKAFAAQASSGGNAAAFGPLALSGGTAGQSAFQGSTLTVPGMQILAWISTPMPFLPPSPK